MSGRKRHRFWKSNMARLKRLDEQEQGRMKESKTMNETIPDSPSQEPPWLVTPWPDLTIDLRTISELEYRPAWTCANTTYSEGVSINHRFHLGVNREVYKRLKAAMMARYAWEHRTVPQSPLTAAEPDLYNALEATQQILGNSPYRDAFGFIDNRLTKNAEVLARARGEQPETEGEPNGR